MTMEYIYFVAACVIALLIFIMLEEYRKGFCKNCGAKMHKHYDPEEDSEIWQCHACGRCYL